MIYDSPPVSVLDGSKALGISQYAFRWARNTLYLFDEPSLSVDQVEVVLEAMREIAAGNVSRTQELIEPLMEERFGDDVSKSRGKSIGGPLGIRQREREELKDAVQNLCVQMRLAEDLRIPWLEDGDRLKMCADIDEAVSSVQKLKKAIKGE